MIKRVNIYPTGPIRSVNPVIFGVTRNVTKSDKEIRACLIARAAVEEILNDNSVIKLDLSNYNTDNNVKVEETVVEQPATQVVEEEITAPVVEEETAEVPTVEEEKVDEEPADETPAEVVEETVDIPTETVEEEKVDEEPADETTPAEVVVEQPVVKNNNNNQNKNYNNKR